jgi:signal transduction histidine kinase
VQSVRRLWRHDRGRLAHYAACVILGVSLIVDLALIDSDEQPWILLCGVAAAVALACTRDAPFLAPLAVLACLGVTVMLDPVPMEEAVTPVLVAILFAPWCLGTYNETRRAVIGLLAVELFAAWVNWRFDGGPADFFFIATFAAIAWSAGFVVNVRSRHAEALSERSRSLERDQAAAAERAVAAERQRIARELHDVIAHSVSVMTVQAGAVRRLLQPGQEQERAALETIESTGRQALTEMRRLVGLLKDESVMPEYAPQPGLASLDTLLDTMREAGLPVDVEYEGAPRPLAPGLDLAAYRVVQEALTNALKYAGPAHAWVSVRFGEDDLEVEVSNDGHDGAADDAVGHGLAGMRERVALYGGQVDTGPRDGGGFIVRARLPLREAGV